jgi:SpoVK/Ycf46/Vps4 family AAA+-type ATPase
LPTPIAPDDFIAACRAELELDIGELAQKVVPRFHDEKLILPPKQQRHFQEVIQAMNSLTEVHYGWGTAKVWSEGGITALFAGAPGTGKTMGAEILAIELDLPMYRIDLSQVVNKYIGETEKNLKRLFDAADVSDIILFFDEADSLFGQRTEVKDAHDRYANLEISYLLERMERFKGLAILATNRAKNLDEAFLRRLRYIIDFPLPDVAQRKEIWRQVTPQAVDASQIDYDFLARQFRLNGGHIRSVVFNACLQSAKGASADAYRTPGRLTMNTIIRAVKREYDKLKQSVSLESFGPYAEIIEAMEGENEAN